jgi:hypothetical protein
MRIKNYQQFYELIKNDNLPIKMKLLECITSIIKTCACKKELKKKRAFGCNEMYVDWVKNNASNFKEHWKLKTNSNTITFFQNDTFEILTINLN